MGVLAWEWPLAQEATPHETDATQGQRAMRLA